MSVLTRIGGWLLVGGVRLLQLLPDRPVYRLGFRLGRLLPRVMGERRELARRNLQRVCRSLVARGGATPRVAAAADGGRPLDDLVGDLFGHWVVSYLEGAMAPRYDAATLRARVRLTDPVTTAAALAPSAAGEPGRIYTGLHLGSVEIAGLYAARLSSLSLAGPMERVGNPVLRDYFERTRAAVGMDLLPIEGAASVLEARLRRGDGVALVADRPIEGQGSRVRLFGASARLPAGPAVLAVTTGAGMYVQAVLRERPGAWVGIIEPIEVPTDGIRRERVRMTLEHITAAFERLIGHAPEQWWTLLFHVWEEEAVS
jgi:KDO2-lipid IV(A) lauroyltransferase